MQHSRSNGAMPAAADGTGSGCCAKMRDFHRACALKRRRRQHIALALVGSGGQQLPSAMVSLCHCRRRHSHNDNNNLSRGKAGRQKTVVPKGKRTFPRFQRFPALLCSFRAAVRPPVFLPRCFIIYTRIYAAPEGRTNRTTNSVNYKHYLLLCIDNCTP